MPSAAYQVFRQAVIEKKQVVCTYQGFPREVCPHAIGYKDGQEKSLTFQFAGQSSSGLPSGGEWRCLFLAQVQNAKIREGDWHTGLGHQQRQTCIDEVDVEINY